MMQNRNIQRESIERCARMYSTNTDAALALGIAAGSFGRLCRQHGIETPHARHRKGNRCPYCQSLKEKDAALCKDCAEQRREAVKGWSEEQEQKRQARLKNRRKGAMA